MKQVAQHLIGTIPANYQPIGNKVSTKYQQIAIAGLYAGKPGASLLYLGGGNISINLPVRKDVIVENKTTILVADDDETILELMRDFLEAEGFRVETVSESREVLQVVKRMVIDCILLDVMMPGLRWAR